MDIISTTCVLTGATGGIGKSLALALAKENVNLVLISKSDKKLSVLKDFLNSKNLEIKTYACDFTNLQEVEKTSQEITRSYPTIDFLINCAGVGVYKPIEELDLNDWSNSLNINLTSTFIFTKNLLPSLKKSNKSIVLNIGSGAGVEGMPGRSLYCTTKFALRGFSLSLSEEFKNTKPDFSLITLGSVLTEFGPLSLQDKKEEELKGKAYLTPESLAEKLITILKEENRQPEYTIYPTNY